MRTADILVFLVVFPAMLIPGWALLVPRIWQGALDAYEGNWPAQMFLGRSSGGAYNGAMPTIVAALTLMYLGLLPDVMSPILPAEWRRGLTYVTVIMLSAMVIAVFLSLSVLLFMRPRHLVPPHLRQSGGILSRSSRNDHPRTRGSS